MTTAASPLNGEFRGRTIRPGDDGYDEARKVYNGLIDRRPALIVEAAGPDDAAAVVDLARDHRLPLAVRGGGHGIAGFGTCDDGVVLDLSALKDIRVDPDRRTVRAGGGCTWGELNRATHAFGLATTGGIVSTTGIAGLTLGGGLGFLARRCGLACDNLVSAEVVTAAGEVVTAGPDHHEDLFWALRGGGGNFGAVTAFEYRLHPVGEIVGGPTFFRPEPEVLGGYGGLVRQAPEELGTVLGLALAPPAPFIPEEWHGQPVCVVISCWTGPATEADTVLSAVERLGPVVGRHVGPMPYPAINTLFDELLPPGLRHYWKGQHIDALPDKAIETHLEFCSTMPSPETATLFFSLDGAAGRVGRGETAFAYRDATFAVGLGASWADPADDEANIAWSRAYDRALRPFALDGGYVNFMAGDDGDRVRDNYQGNYDRLAQVKQRYDPDNLFRLNHNIRPEV